MDPSTLRITADPLTSAMCRFTVDRPVYANESFYFGNRDIASASPLASRLFALEGVAAVLISHDQITVTKGGFEDWPIIGKKIGAAIREWFADHGFTGLERWQITQEDRLAANREADQFGIFTVERGGSIDLELFFLDASRSGGVRREPAVRLR